MSTRFESTWLDQKYCVTLNETPTTRMAGSTSRVSPHPTIARTSQNGTMMPVMGRMRPIIALRSDSGRPDTAASVCTGVPMAPHATRSEEHTSELQSQSNLVCRLLLEKKNKYP